MSWKLTGLGLLVFAAVPAQASNSDSSRIHGLLPIANAVIFYHDGNRTSPPACVTSGNRWAIDASTPGGQAETTVLLTAYSLGKKVTIVGSRGGFKFTGEKGVSTGAEHGARNGLPQYG